MSLHHRPRIMIAGERSGVGKTTIALGIMAALRRRGLKVQPFKAGPDFLDPMHHSQVAGRPSRNLDTWMFPEYVLESFLRASEGADISVIEGVMGLYDGFDGRSEEGSSAHLAKTLRCPVALVIGASSSSRSLGALALGFASYDKEVDLRAVIFNRISGEKHLQIAEDSLKGLLSLGGIPQRKEAHLSSRHLGLVPAEEEDNSQRYEEARRMVEENLDLDMLVEIARSAPDLEGEVFPHDKESADCRIGVARDEAFNFYYEDNFDLLRAAGAELEFFSPLREGVPDVDGLYIGGGYPEIFAQRLAENEECITRIREECLAGVPVYAECGGMMYLCSRLVDLQGNSHRMASVFQEEVRMGDRLQALGYVRMRVLRDNILSRQGDEIRGHVFHYSSVPSSETRAWAYELSKPGGISGRMDGLMRCNTLASYSHLHFGTDPRIARRFVEACTGR
ncbi:MAG: cobyrinate a,c-diamide synthase [Methanomassiliicoccales archaeon]